MFLGRAGTNAKDKICVCQYGVFMSVVLGLT